MTNICPECQHFIANHAKEGDPPRCFLRCGCTKRRPKDMVPMSERVNF